MTNLWKASSSLLGEAYEEKARPERFAVVTRSILGHTNAAGPLRILDIGGGHGGQAINFARLGHSVHILDSDAAMLERARRRFSFERELVQQNAKFITGDGEAAPELCDTPFDVVCCHSVIMYVEDFEGILLAAIRSLRRGGILSVLHLNIHSLAMRAGLQGNWREALGYLRSDDHQGHAYAGSYRHKFEHIANFLERCDMEVIDVNGVGIFTDHHRQKHSGAELEEVIEAEWLAGKIEPYKSIARNLHIMALRR